MTFKARTVFAAIAVVSGVALAAWGRAERWEAELATGVAGLWIGIAGFAVAITEIRRAATVSEATQKAVRRTLQAVAVNRLAVTITQMRQVVEQVEDARSRRSARKAINEWRLLASDADYFVRRRFGDAHPVLPTLARSLRVAGNTKRRLHPNVDLERIKRPCLEAMDKATDELGPLLHQLLPNIDEEDVDG